MADTPSITHSVTSGRSAYGREAQVVRYMASLRACEHTPADRKPIDLVLVIDKSGSMSGEKMELTKETAELVAKELGASDRLSIVTYDTGVYCPMPLAAMDKKGKAMAAETIGEIRPGSATNLSGGLLRGIEELSKAATGAETASVLLLTDGLANNGIRDTDGIVRCLEGVMGAMARPATVFTFGYGEDHDASMLRAIADAGGGVYYFMEDGDSVATSFADCLGGLLSVVGQNVRLALSASGGATVLGALGKAYQATGEGTGTLELAIGDVYSEETKDILFEVSLPAAAGAEVTVTASLAYMDIVKAELVTSAIASAVVARADADGAPNMAVEEQVNRVEAAEVLKAAGARARRGSFSGGCELLSAMEAKFEASPAAATPMNQQLIADLRECRSGMADRDSYRRQGSYAVESMEQCHSKQRSNKSASSPHFSYETKSKSAMKTRWRSERAERQSEPKKQAGTVVAGALQTIPASPLPRMQQTSSATLLQKAQKLQEQGQPQAQPTLGFFASMSTSVGSLFAGGAK